MLGSVYVDYRLLSLRSRDESDTDGVADDFVGNLRGYDGGFDLLTARWGGTIRFDVTVWDGEPDGLNGVCVEFAITSETTPYFTSATTDQYLPAVDLHLVPGRRYRVHAIGTGTSRSQIFVDDDNEFWHVDIWPTGLEASS